MTDQEIFEKIQMHGGIPRLRELVGKRRFNGKPPSRDTIYNAFNAEATTPARRLIRQTAAELAAELADVPLPICKGSPIAARAMQEFSPA